MLTDSRVAAFKAPASGQKEYPDNKVTGLRLRVGAGGTKTWIFRGRAGDRTIGRVLSHALTGVTARVYALHSYGPEKREALDTWAAEVERATSGTQPTS